MTKTPNAKIGYDSYISPIGPIYVVADEYGVRKVAMTGEDWAKDRDELGAVPHDPVLCQEAIQQLDEYFKGQRKQFTVPLSIQGTDFRKKVWQALLAIPYGEVRSYQDIAKVIGKPQAPRAIGQANRANPLPIFIPCHRVIGKSGDLVGYAGTRTDIKSLLLELEGVTTTGSRVRT